MKVGISPVQPLCSQENCTSNCLSWHNRWGHVSWLLTQKSSSHGPLTFFSSLASISVLRRARLLSWQNSSRLLLKGKQNNPTTQTSACLLCCFALFIPTAVVSSGMFVDSKGQEAKSLTGDAPADSTMVGRRCFSLCFSLWSSGKESKSTCTSRVKQILFEFWRSTYIFLALSLPFFNTLNLFKRLTCSIYLKLIIQLSLTS